MRKLLLTISFILAYASIARCDSGLDLLGLQHPKFPVKDVVDLVPDGFISGNLDWTFGTSLAPIKRVLNTGKVKRWRAHFFNGPGLRNGQLGSYEPHFRYTISSFSDAWERRDSALRNHLKSRVELYCNLFAQYPLVTLELSPTLEHNLSHAAFRQQSAVIRQTCRRAVLVDNPVGGVAFTRGKQEKHGTHPQVKSPCNVSLDGDTAEDVNVPAYLKRYKKCESVYIWSRTLNGRLGSGDFIDPRARNAWPTRDHLRALFRYLLPVEPPQLAQCREVAAPRLFKPFADDKGIDDPRANKPLWLSPVRLDEVSVHSAITGALIVTLPYYGPFDGGGHRYYSPLSGTHIADRSEYVYVQEGSQCFGSFHPSYRQGSFR